jgi:hypothetical protein
MILRLSKVNQLSMNQFRMLNNKFNKQFRHQCKYNQIFNKNQLKKVKK